MNFQDSVKEAEALTKALKAAKISFGTVKEIIPAPPIGDIKHESYLGALLRNGNDSAIASHISGATNFDLFVVFEEPKDSFEITMQLFMDCKPAFVQLHLLDDL